MDVAPTDALLNIGAASRISIKGMAQMIQRKVGYTGVSKMDGNPYKTVDGSRAKTIFGLSPEMSLEQGIHDTVQWYMENN